MEKETIFSGENSRDLWNAINKLDSKSKGDKIRDVIYFVCCKLQELEDKIEEKE